MFDALEAAGLLVVEVPAALERESPSRIADYLNAQLAVGARATTERMAGLAACGPAPAPEESPAPELSDDEEADLLEFMNDPANQLGGPF